MVDVDLPPIRKFKVIDEHGSILLITSGILTASFYQTQYNKQKPSKKHRINCVGGDKLFTDNIGE